MFHAERSEVCDTISINELKAAKAGDNALWTPLQCAEAFARDIRNGSIKPQRLLMIYEETEPDGGLTVATYAANVQRDSEIVLLHLRLHLATHKWVNTG